MLPTREEIEQAMVGGRASGLPYGSAIMTMINSKFEDEIIKLGGKMQSADTNEITYVMDDESFNKLLKLLEEEQSESI